MLDLSNNNGSVHFATVHKHGQRRVYLKLTEGTGFHDSKHDGFRSAAIRAGLKVGEYHFARPSQSTPKEEADFFLRHLPALHHRHALRPCLDLEDPNAHAGPHVGKWAAEWIARVHDGCGHRPILYGSTFYIAECAFPKAPAPLWLASYGRNDGREYPFEIPKPWTKIAAHQFTSVARVAGVADPVDLSRVLRRRALAIYHPSALEPRV